MKINKDFLVTELGDEVLLIPTGQAEDSFRGIVRLNETAAFIVNCLKEEATPEQITDALLAEYEVERTAAKNHIDELIENLRKIGAIEG